LKCGPHDFDPLVNNNSHTPLHPNLYQRGHIHDNDDDYDDDDDDDIKKKL